MDIKECYRLTHPLSKISGYATGMEDWTPKVPEHLDVPESRRNRSN